MPLTSIGRGTTVDTRIGRRILLTKVHHWTQFKVSGLCQQLTGDFPEKEELRLPRNVYVHLVFFQHKDGGSVPNPGHLYETTVGGDASTTSLRKKDYSSAYHVVKKYTKKVELDWERMLYVAGTTGQADGHYVAQGTCIIDKVMKVGKVVTYKENTADPVVPADHENNGLYCMAWAENVVTSDAGTQTVKTRLITSVQQKSRVYWYDI